MRQLEKLTVEVEDDNAHLLKSGPVVAFKFQKIKQRIHADNQKNKMQEDKLRSKRDKASIRRKQLSCNLKDIKERALLQNDKKPFDKVEMRHTNSKRRTASRFDNWTSF